MIAKLFRRLTAGPDAGAALFDWATRATRQPGWYVEGSIPDTIDGRFAVLSAVTALCVLRVESLGRDGEALSVALTERFAEVMESEHRELGLGDPTLGKTVLKLVGSLAKKVDALRAPMTAQGDWRSAADAIFAEGPDERASDWRAERLKAFAERLGGAGLDQLARGEVP